MHAHICISISTVGNRSLIYEIILYEDQIARISFFMAPHPQSGLRISEEGQSKLQRLIAEQ